MKFNYNPEYKPNPAAKLIDFDVASMYVCPIKPLEIKETTMTIETNKTYKLVEPAVNSQDLVSGYKTLADVFGECEFVVESFVKSNWFDKAYILKATLVETGNREQILVYDAEIELFREVEVEQDPTDLLTKAVAIKTPFISVCGWVTDQWIEDGVELLNVVHAGDFTVCPRSAVINILN